MYRWKSKDSPAVLPQKSRFRNFDACLYIITSDTQHVSVVLWKYKTRFSVSPISYISSNFFTKEFYFMKSDPGFFSGYLSWGGGGGVWLGGGGGASLFVLYCVDLKEPRDDHDLAWSRRKTSSRRMGFTSFPDYADEEDQVEELNNNIREPFINTLSNLTWKLADNLPCQKMAERAQTY